MVEKTLHFDDYKTCLFDGKDIYREQMTFKSTEHDVYTVNINKIALNRGDDERIIQKDGISTLAIGHYRV